MSNRVELLGRGPRADALYREMQKRLGTELDGYDVLALTYDDGRKTGALSIKWGDGYASVDVFAPGFRPSRKIIKIFFGFIFARRGVVLCAVQKENDVSARFVERVGFEKIGAYESTELYRLTEEQFVRRFLRKRGCL